MCQRMITILFLVCAFCIGGSAYGQKVNYQQFENIYLGAEASVISCFLQDSEGLIWIGSNKGLATKDFIQILIDEIELPIIVDAGIGRPSQACEAMEMGAAAIMANTALATAGNLPLMASAFKDAINSGRKAYLAGLGRVLTRGASASDPLTGFLHD